jgi:hypothetical protein
MSKGEFLCLDRVDAVARSPGRLMHLVFNSTYGGTQSLSRHVPVDNFRGLTRADGVSVIGNAFRRNRPLSHAHLKNRSFG